MLIIYPRGMTAGTGRNGQILVVAHGKLIDCALRARSLADRSKVHSARYASITIDFGHSGGVRVQPTVRITDVKGWPLCRTCVRTRIFWLIVSGVMFYGGLLAFVGSMIVGLIAEKGTVEPLAAVAMLGFILLPLAAFPFYVGSIPRLIGARTAPEGG